MSQSSAEDSADRERRLDEILVAYLRAEDAGLRPDKNEFIARHPDLAAELEEYFRDQAELNDRVEPIRPTGQSATDPAADFVGEPTIVPSPTVLTDVVDSDSSADSSMSEDDLLQAALPGARLRYFGNYELLAEIARGGMGVVFKARQVKLNRIVAVKMILAGQLASSEEVRRFRSEAEAAAQLQHPNIVGIHEVGDHQGQQYFSMDFVEGTNLAAQLREHPLSEKQAAESLRTIAAAIQYAHSKGVLHRDLKPSNVLIDANQQPKVTDFGLAKRIEGGSELTRSGQILGTPSYMPPEQAGANHGAIGPASDVYSLGAILYEAVAGRPPFRAETALETVMQVLKAEPVAPRLLNPKLSRDLETIILKCLQKAPSSRYRTAQELADDLQRFLNGEPILARPVSAAERAWRWCRRNPVVASLSAAVAVALITVTCVSLVAYALTKDALGKMTVAKSDAQEQRGKAVRLAADKVKLADQEKTARETSERALKATRHQLALNYLQRGVALSEAKKPWTGLSWMHRALGTAEPDDSLRASILKVMAGWDPSLGICLPHTNPVRFVRFSPDGKTIVTGGDDPIARLWDAETGAPRGAPMRHDKKITVLALSPNGEHVLTASDDKTARMWDAKTGEPRGEPLVHDRLVNQLAFSPDSRTFVTGSHLPMSARLWETATRRPLGVPLQHQIGFHGVAFSPDGRLLLTLAYTSVIFWDATTGEPNGAPLRHDSRVTAAAISPDGKTVVTGHDDRSTRRWDLATRQLIGSPLTLSAAPRLVVFAPDGQHALVTAGQFGHLWNMGTSKIRGVRHELDIFAANFSADSTLLVTGSSDGTAKVTDLRNFETRGVPLRHDRSVLSVAVSPDGQRILTGSVDCTARLWNASAGESRTVCRHPNLEFGWIAALSPDGQTVAAPGPINNLLFWDAATGERRETSIRQEVSDFCLSYGSDSRTIMTGSGTVAQCWDVSTGDPRGAPLRHEKPLNDIELSANNSRVLAGSVDAGWLWNLSADKPTAMRLDHPGSVIAVALSPNGKLAATGGDDGLVRLWETATGNAVGGPLVHESKVDAVVFSPDSRTLLTGTEHGYAQLWDVASGHPSDITVRHDFAVNSVAFLSDGKTFLTGSNDRTSRLWDAVTGEARGPAILYEVSGVVRSIAASSDGRTLMTASREPGVAARLWDIAPPFPDEPERIRCYVEVQTGQTWDANGVLRTLTIEAWFARRERLEQLGGPPVPERAARRMTRPIIARTTPSVRQPVWTPLALTKSSSKGGATFQKLDNGSLLASGQNPDKDTYVIVADTEHRTISGVRLEVLKHDSLPGGGPGRLENGTFILSRVEINAAPIGSSEPTKAVAVSKVSADFSQPGYGAISLIDGKPGPGWAIFNNGTANHHVDFQFDKPFKSETGVKLIITLKHESPSAAANLGCFRLFVDSGE